MSLDTKALRQERFSQRVLLPLLLLLRMIKKTRSRQSRRLVAFLKLQLVLLKIQLLMQLWVIFFTLISNNNNNNEPLLLLLCFPNLSFAPDKGWQWNKISKINIFSLYVSSIFWFWFLKPSNQVFHDHWLQFCCTVLLRSITSDQPVLNALAQFWGLLHSCCAIIYFFQPAFYIWDKIEICLFYRRELV